MIASHFSISGTPLSADELQGIDAGGGRRIIYPSVRSICWITRY